MRRLCRFDGASGRRTTSDAPKKAAYVTLRATAGDDRGNAFRQTITRAVGPR
ncbi:hypothetical protein ACFQ0G_09040 [Streptomyces chiangmaiensis]